MFAFFKRKTLKQNLDPNFILFFFIITESKYTNLCALCQNPLSCYGDDKYYGEEGSLICLTENVGDIVWTKWSSAWSHFEVPI